MATTAQKRALVARRQKHYAAMKRKNDLARAMQEKIAAKDAMRSISPQGKTHALENASRRLADIAEIEEEPLMVPTVPIEDVTNAGTPPARAKCPKCGYSQKVTKAGVMGTHSALGGVSRAICDGVGVRWDA